MVRCVLAGLWEGDWVTSAHPFPLPDAEDYYRRVDELTQAALQELTCIGRWLRYSYGLLLSMA